MTPARPSRWWWCAGAGGRSFERESTRWGERGDDDREHMCICFMCKFTHVRASRPLPQIQDTIDSLIGSSGGLERRDDVLQVLRLFNTVFSNQYNKSEIFGDASQGYSKNLENNPRELSLLLECFTHTTMQGVLKIIAEVTRRSIDRTRRGRGRRRGRECV